MQKQNKQSIVFLGATGAVGSVALNHLLSFNNVSILTLGRRPVQVENKPDNIEQQIIDIHKPSTYKEYIKDCETAICTLGVGEPSKISKDDFVAIDKNAVVNFAKECKISGVNHFQLLSSVGVSSKARNFYLRTKGELIDELISLGFEHLSIFQPSMILTPNNRYGFTQYLTLKIWPKLNIILLKKLRKYRGIKVEILGKAIANNAFSHKQGVEYLQYDDFLNLQE